MCIEPEAGCATMSYLPSLYWLRCGRIAVLGLAGSLGMRAQRGIAQADHVVGAQGATVLAQLLDLLLLQARDALQGPVGHWTRLGCCDCLVAGLHASPYR